MLPRQSNNSKKYELKRKNSFEGKKKLTGMAAIQSNLENKKLGKTNSTRPQTAAYSKGNLVKPRTGIPSLGGNGIKKTKSDNSNPSLKGVKQSRIHQLLKNNPSGAAATIQKQPVPEPYGNSLLKPFLEEEEDIDVERRLDENIQNAHRMRKESNPSLEPTPYNPPVSTPQADYLIDDEPLLEPSSPTEEPYDPGLADLKTNHDQLVDLILREEDDLISKHHKFIENTINSGKFFLLIL